MIIVTAAFPFVPAELNIAHFASTYVPADVETRLLNIAGDRAVLVSATDYHSIYASADGRKIDEGLCRVYHQKYLEIFKRMQIDFDAYIVTEDEAHKAHVKEAFQALLEKDKIYEGQTEDTVCSNCGCHLPKRFAGEDGVGKCRFCGSTELTAKKVQHYFLRVSGTEESVRTFAAAAEQKDIRNMMLQYAGQKLLDWDFTRNNELGVKVSEDSQLSIYIWFDSLVGYYSLMQKYQEEVQQVMHFIGKNIVYYHSVIWPLIYREAFQGTASLQLSARGFLDFKNTDGSMVELMTLTQDFHPDFVRFYLAFKVKDNITDYSFSMDDFKKIAEFYCCRQLGGLFFQIWKGLTAAGVPKSCAKGCLSDETERVRIQFTEQLQREIHAMHVHEALRLILKHAEYIRGILKQQKGHMDCEEVQDYFKEEAALLVCVLAAFMPDLAEQYTIFEGWVPENLSEVRNYQSHVLKHEKEMIRINGK